MAIIGTEFGLPTSSIQLTISTFLAGLALGQLGWGSVSDHFGRRGPLLAGLGLFVLASVGCALATSLDQLLAARLMQGIGASAGQVLSRAVISDRFQGRGAARMLTSQQLVMGLGPMFAPLIGAALLLIGSWRLIFWALACLGISITILVMLRVRESRSAETLALARSERRHVAYWRLLRNSHVLAHVVGGGLTSAAFLSWLGGSAMLLQDEWGWSPQQMALLFALCGGLIIGISQLNRIFLSYAEPATIRDVGICWAIALAVIGLLCWSTGFGGRAAIVGCIIGALACHALVSANNQASALVLDRLRGGSLSALLGASTFLAGAIATWGISHFAPRGGVVLITSILGFYGTALAVNLLPRATLRLR